MEGVVKCQMQTNGKYTYRSGAWLGSQQSDITGNFARACTMVEQHSMHGHHHPATPAALSASESSFCNGNGMIMYMDGRYFLGRAGSSSSWQVLEVCSLSLARTVSPFPHHAFSPTKGSTGHPGVAMTVSLSSFRAGNYTPIGISTWLAAALCSWPLA